MGFWRKLLAVANKTLSTALGFVGIPASANTIHNYEKALFSSNPIKNLATEIGQNINALEPSDVQNLVVKASENMSKTLGLPISTELIEKSAKAIHRHATGQKLTRREIRALNNRADPSHTNIYHLRHAIQQRYPNVNKGRKLTLKHII